MSKAATRLDFLTAGAAGALGLVASTLPAGAAPLHAEAQKGLDALIAGNARFVADKAICPPLTARRLELAQGQSPFAIILSCSDSRVPVEIVFDQMPGAIFGVRIAGNYVDDSGLGSMEYAVEHLHSSLILVLGHTSCGAVSAAVQFAKDGKPAPEHIQTVVSAIEPAATSTKGQAGNWVENACAANVKNNVAALMSRSHIIAEHVEAKKLSIAGGVYHLDTGRVAIIT